MTFDVAQFRAKVGSPLRSDKYIVRIEQVPPGLRGSGIDKIGPDMEFWCEMVDVPGVSLMTGEVRTYGYGPSEKKPYAPMFEECRTVFRIDQDAKVFGFLKAWQALALNYELDGTISDQTGRVGTGGATGSSRLSSTPFEVGYKEDYAVPVSVIVFRDDGKQAFKVTMQDAYPVNVGALPLSWGALNAYAQLPVSFAFSQIVTLGVRFGTQ